MKARDAAALASLERDHRLLWGLTDALHAYVDALDRGRPLRRGDLKAIASGLRVVADYRHFEKEEEVMVPVLVRHGFDYHLRILDDGRREHDSLRYLIEVLHQSAERELNWNLDERERISRVAHQLIERQRRLSTHQEACLFPEIVARLEPPALGQLTEQLCQFDESTAAREPALDVAGLTRNVLGFYGAHSAESLPPARETSRAATETAG
jgi:hemerythrin-like domain-containing protein